MPPPRRPPPPDRSPYGYATQYTPTPKKKKPAPKVTQPTPTRTVTAPKKVVPPPLTLAQQAAQQVDLVIDPQVAAATAQASSQSNTLKAAYEALSKMQAGIAPQVQQAYTGAANSTAGFAKGFSDAVQQQSSGAATDANQALANLGSPQEVVSRLATGGSDALYGMGGYIPASQLAREGAAFTSAAANLPAMSTGLGIDAQKSANQSAIQALQQIEATRPQLLQQAMQNVLSQRAAQQDYVLKQQTFKAQQTAQAQDYAIKRAALAQNQALARGKFGLEVNAANLAAQKANNDWKIKSAGLTLSERRVAIAAQKAQNDANFKAAKNARDAANYYVDKQGHQVPKGYVYNKNGNLVKSATAPKAGAGAKPASTTARSKALTLAEDFYKGVAPVTRADGTVSRPGKPPVKYQIALKRIQGLGLKFAEAQALLDTFYQRGEGGRPIFSFQERQRLRRLGVQGAYLQQLTNNWLNATTPEGKAAAWAKIQPLLDRAAG